MDGGKIENHFDVTLRWNQEATDLMKAGDYESALVLLHTAEVAAVRTSASQREMQLLGVIYNNLGCCYMKAKQMEPAVKYLTKALVTETSGEGAAGTRINLSSVYYQMKEYQQALAEALKTLHALEARPRASKEERLYAKVLHCAGMAYEALGKKRKALLSYFRGVCTATEKLGPEHELTMTLSKKYESLSKQKEMVHNSSSESALLKFGTWAVSRESAPLVPLFTKVTAHSQTKISFRAPKPPPDSIFCNKEIAQKKPLKTSTSTPKMKRRQRVSPTNLSSTAASSNDLGVLKVPRTLQVSPNSKKIRSRRIRAPSENQTNITRGDSSSDVEIRIHSIDEKLMNLTQRLSEYGYKNSEVRRIAEKQAAVLSSRLTTPAEDVDECDCDSLRRTVSAVAIQRHIRGFLARKHFDILKKRTEPLKIRPCIQDHGTHPRRKLILTASKRSGRLIRYSMYNAK